MSKYKSLQDLKSIVSLLKEGVQYFTTHERPTLEKVLLVSSHTVTQDTLDASASLLRAHGLESTVSETLQQHTAYSPNRVFQSTAITKQLAGITRNTAIWPVSKDFKVPVSAVARYGKQSLIPGTLLFPTPSSSIKKHVLAPSLQDLAAANRYLEGKDGLAVRLKTSEEMPITPRYGMTVPYTLCATPPVLPECDSPILVVTIDDTSLRTAQWRSRLADLIEIAAKKKAALVLVDPKQAISSIYDKMDINGRCRTQGVPLAWIREEIPALGNTEGAIVLTSEGPALLNGFLDHLKEIAHLVLPSLESPQKPSATPVLSHQHGKALEHAQAKQIEQAMGL